MWIIPQHHTQIDRFYEIISLLKKVDFNDLKNIRNNIITELKDKGRYKGRQTKDLISAGNHNIDEPFFYGLIYKINKEVFVSNYGELIYDVWNDNFKKSIVFIYSLFNIQYYHPAKPRVESEIYPFRLFFKVLRDSRIDNKISVPEMFFLYQIDKISSDEDFEFIIKNILDYRKSGLELKDYFVKENDSFVKSAVSAKYFLKILENFDILIQPDSIEENQFVLSSVRRDPTSINRKHLFLNNSFIKTIDSLLNRHSIFEQIRNSELPSELASEIFNYVDDEIYKDLNIEKNKDYTLADNIYNYSINPNKCYDFEIKINEAMNLFYDIKSEVVGGSSEPDFVAKYKPFFPDSIESKIFTGDAKSTKNQLQGINPGRLRQHMSKYNSNFTLLITPKYSPAAKKDIHGEKIVILSSLALSEVARNIIKNDDKPSFSPFYDIIINNLGEDVSDKFYNKMSEIYGISLK
jgi:type II restriction enzyme